MALRRFFGGSSAPAPEVVERPPAPSSDTDTVRRIVGELESMPEERARFAEDQHRIALSVTASGSEVEGRKVEIASEQGQVGPRIAQK